MIDKLANVGLYVLGGMLGVSLFMMLAVIIVLLWGTLRAAIEMIQDEF